MQAVLNAALPLFALIFTGYLCGRFGMFSREATDILNRFAVYLALPALMFLAMSKVTPEQVGQAGLLLAFGGGLDVVEHVVGPDEAGPIAERKTTLPVLAVVRGDEVLRFDDPRAGELQEGDRLVCLC